MAKKKKKQQNRPAPQPAPQLDMEQIQNYFATLNRNLIRDLNRSTNDRSSTIYSTYTVDEIMRYLRAPETSAATLRQISRQLYHTSTHYRRLINYYVFMPLWYYTVQPLAFDPSKANPQKYRKAYMKALKYLENANIPHEMMKVMLNGFVDGIFYGVIWQSSNSFYIQKIDPDICYLSAMEDGRWCFAVDFSRIRENQLYLYPPEFTTLYQQYKTTGQKELEIPSAISFVYKPDESTMFPIPPFISLAPDVLELENIRDLLGSATELDNYKLLQMIVETKDGQPSMPMALNQMFLEHIQKAVPEGIGVAMSPGKLQEITFDRSKPTNNMQELSTAISNFWYNGGTLGALFGNPDITTSSAIRIAIKVDEEYIYGCLTQLERVLNALLKQLSGSITFRMQFIQCTVFSRDDVQKSLKEAATLGVPGSKIAYAATLGLTQSSLEGMAFLENEVLKVNDTWIPLKSSYNQSQGEAGRPAASDDEMSEATERSRDNDSNENKEEDGS